MKNIKEFKPGWREFYTIKKFIDETSKNSIVKSWNAKEWTKINESLLSFKVNSKNHNGPIFVAINDSDLFDVWFTNFDGIIIKEIKDVYLFDFIDVINNEIMK